MQYTVILDTNYQTFRYNQSNFLVILEIENMYGNFPNSESTMN